MKRDLQINYGVLDDIIGELRTYKRALEKMDHSLDKVNTFIRTNDGKSVEAWDQNIHTSKEKIANYEIQIDDLLSLFENYVTDTTRYISPLSRNAMMRVDCNDIWANLKQIDSGITTNVFKALNKSYQQPASFFGLFDDPTDEEKKASEINRRHMVRIQTSIESTRKKLQNNMDELWDMYNSKVKRFENADDAYNNKAGNVKKKYTNFFEGVWDVVSSVNKALDDFERGIEESIAGIITGLTTVVKDAGVVAVSGIVPDPIEPSWLKDSANQTVDAYSQAALQFIQDPMRAVESAAQAFTDTVEQEGVMYATGAAVAALIPGSWAVKGASGAARLAAGAARKAPKLLDKKPFSGNYYREKIDVAKAQMAKIADMFSFGEKYAVSTGGASFILRDKDLENHVSPQMVNMKNGGGERLETKGAGNKIDSDTIKKYIRDIEGRTGRELPKNQIEKLKGALRNKEYKKMSPIETAKHRAEFDKVKNKVIREWEENTGQKWPVYNENVISEKTDKIIRKQGDKYDAHHIIENTFGGEHEWWNMHPAKFPNEHQAGIHGTGSPANRLFKGGKK